MFRFAYCFLVVLKVIEASFCGKNELPSSFEITENNDFILKCSIPPCLNIFKPTVSINGRHLSGMRLFGFNKKAKEISNFDICEKNSISTKCVNDGEWIGGIEAETENSNKLILLCCKHDAAKAAKFLDTFDLEKEEIVKGGPVKMNGKIKAFDYISNVVKYIDGNENIVYKVFVNRLPCSSNTVTKHSGRSKLFQALTLSGNNGGGLQEINDFDDIHVAEYNGDGGTTSVELDDCPGNNNTGISDEESERAGPLPFPRMPQFEPSLRLYQAPLLINQIPRSHLSRLYQAPIASADDNDDSSSDDDDDDMDPNQNPPDNNNNNNDDNDAGNNRVQLDGCATPPPSNQNPSPPNNPNSNPMPPQQNPVSPPTPPVTPMPPPPMMCFSGDTIVTTLNYSKKRLDELKIDEWILSAGDERIGFNKVISWLHRMPSVKAEFIKFTLENGRTLKITRKHFIYKIDCSAMPPPTKKSKIANDNLEAAREALKEVNASKDDNMEEELNEKEEKKKKSEDKSSSVTPQRYSSRRTSRDVNYTPSPTRSFSESAQERKRKTAQQVGQNNKGRTTPVSARSKRMKEYNRTFHEQEITMDELAQETLNDIEEAGNIEDTLRQEREEQFEAFGNMLDEGCGRSEELTDALNKIQELDGKIVKLSNEKKALVSKLKYDYEKQKKLNKAMEKRVQRQTFLPPKARKPFTQLKKSSSKAEAVEKFKSIVSSIFTCYLFVDFFAITRIAWPNIKTPFSLLSRSQTWQFMNEMDISFTRMRKMKRFFKECGFNIFSSEGSVYALIKSVANATVTIASKVNIKGKEVELKCSRIKSLRDLIQQRVLAQLRGGRFPRNLKVLHLCLGFDKGGTTTKLVLMMGSLKSRNGPRNMSLLALFKGEESPEELTAAFQSIIDETKTIKRIQIGKRNIQVKFRFTGDLKCLKSCLGLKAGNPNNPCIYCLQFKETTFECYVNQSGEIRENYNFESNLPGQGHLGCLSWIKPEHIVLPSLHISMGTGEIIIDLLISSIVVKKALNLAGFDLDKLRKKHEKMAEAAEKLKEERNRLNEWRKIYENIRLKMLLPPETNWPEGCDETNWDGEICCSSICLAKISNIFIPQRYSPSDDIVVPDWLENKDRMWFHTICLGLSTNQATIDAKTRNYNPPLKSKNEMLIQVKNEIELLEKEVERCEEKLKAEMDNIKLPKEFDDHSSVNALFKIFENFGAYKTAFFQRFTGNHIRAILKAAMPEEDGTSKLHKKLLQNSELKDLLDPKSPNFDEKFKYGLDALHILALVQDKFKSRTLAPFEIEELKQNLATLEQIMKKFPEARVGHKFHLLLKHVGFVAERDKTIGFFSEHGIEAMHAIVNKLMQRLTVRNNESRLERVIQFVNANAVTRDEFGEIDPLRKQKLQEEEKCDDLEAGNFENESDEIFDDPFPDDFDEEEEINANEIIFIDFNESSLE